MEDTPLPAGWVPNPWFTFGSGLPEATAATASLASSGTVVAITQEQGGVRGPEPGYHLQHGAAPVIYVPTSLPASHPYPVPDYLPLQLGTELVFVLCALMAAVAFVRRRHVRIGHLAIWPRAP